MSETYVFGYGSLVSPDSVGGTLGHEVDAGRMRRAHLAGWTRSWNVGSDRDSHPERTFYIRDVSAPGELGRVFDGVTVVLGIEPTYSAAGCNGSVFPVDRHDLAFLDVRERNYERTEVTEQVTWADKPDKCVVYTYVPKLEAINRVTSAQKSGRAINIRREYVDLVVAAFASVGELSAYEKTTPKPPHDIEDMRSVIDPNVAAPVATNAGSSYDASSGNSVAERDSVAAADETQVTEHRT